MIRSGSRGHYLEMTQTGLVFGDETSASEEVSVREESEVRVRALVDAHYEFVWRSLRRLGVQSGDVDDGVQKVFWVACRRLSSIRAGSERAFLFQTAVRVAADARRADRRSREVIGGESEDLPDPRPGPDELLDRQRARVVLDRILDEMTLEHRAVFVLFELEQMTLTEIAELIGIPRGTAASRLRKARSQFQERTSRLLHTRPGGER